MINEKYNFPQSISDYNLNRRKWQIECITVEVGNINRFALCTPWEPRALF